MAVGDIENGDPREGLLKGLHLVRPADPPYPVADAVGSGKIIEGRPLLRLLRDGPDIRPVMIHAQLLGPDQLPKVKALGMIPSFFIAHIFHWGDIHIRNFGLERASNISPAGSALRLGIPFTFHQDSPVIRPNMAETLWCAVCRHTRQGILLGADQRIPVESALAAVTANAAWQYGEEGEKGSNTPGKRADLVILRQNPLKLPPEELKDLTVMETIKDGQSIWRKP